MAIEIDGKVYRNLPEQVEENANNIENIKARISELGTVMVYKGSVATYADLPTENQKVGDFYNVLDTGDNYAWDGEGWDQVASSVDLSNLVDLDSAQTITGNKNFTGDLKKNNIDVATINQAFNVINASDIVSNTLTNDQYALITNGKPTLINGTLFGYNNMLITAMTDDSYSTRYLLFISNTGAYNIDFRFISLNTSTLVMTLGNLIRINTSGYPTIANKQLPTYPTSPSSSKVLTYGSDNNLSWGDGIFNVINASDITSNTLTQAQYDLITNGKPTLIIGNIQNIINGVWYYCGNFPTNAVFRVMGQSSQTGYFAEKSIVCNLTTKVLSAPSDKLVNFDNLQMVNGKIIPNYPASTGTFNLQIVNGTMGWNTASSGGLKLYKHTFSGIAGAPGVLTIISATPELTGVDLASVKTLVADRIRGYYNNTISLTVYDILKSNNATTQINTTYNGTSGTPPVETILTFAVTESALMGATYACTEITNP